MKNIVVSGASKGIGKAIVEKFAFHGFNIAFCSRNEANVNALKHGLAEKYKDIKIIGISADVSKKKDLQSFSETVLSEFKQVDVLVNNAGIFLQGDLYNMSYADFDQILKTNLYSAFQLTQHFVPGMIQQNKGYIFNISSIAGLEAYDNGGAYNVSKHALTGFSKTLRNELKAHHIKVSTIYPGATLTDSWQGTDLPEERFMPPEDIAKALYQIYDLSDRTVVEDIVLRPQLGDIKIT